MGTGGRLILCGICLIGLAACEPVALTAFGVGASAGVTHTMNGYTYRTFTASSVAVKAATLVALNRMSIKVASTRKEDSGELILAKAGDRDIELQVEVISANTTRLRAIAKQGMFYDSATAVEIIVQTEKVLGSHT